MATTRGVVVDSLPDAGRKYVYAGPMKTFYKDASDTKGTKRGEEVTLTGEQIKRAVQYGSQFKTVSGDPIRTQAQIDAFSNPVTDANTPAPADTP